MNSKFFFTLVGLFIAVFAICNLNLKTTSEPFLMYPLKTYRSPYVKNEHGQEVDLGTTLLGPYSDNNFIKNTKLQKNLSCRMQPWNGYTANITYSMPDDNHLAVPTSCNNDAFSNMATTKEGFCSSGKNSCGSVPSCNKDGRNSSFAGSSPTIPAGFTSGNYQDVTNQARHNNSTVTVNTGASLPVSTLTSLNADGQEIESVCYDRLIYAGQKSNLRALGDHIRGDLAIAPCNNGWFNVSVKPAIDLNTGALAVMGGVHNESANYTSNLVFNSSGSTLTTTGGVDTASVNMSNQVCATIDAQELGSVVNAVAFA